MSDNFESMGGFFVSLMLKVDKGSFNKANKYLRSTKKELSGLTSTTKSSSKALGGFAGLAVAAGVAVVAAGVAVAKMAVSMSELELKTVMLARALRMSSSELAAIKVMAMTSGVNVDGLTNSLAQLQKKSDRLRLGEVDVNMAKSLGLLNIGYQQFLKMSSGQKMSSVMNSAMKMKNKGMAGELVRDTLGDSGKDLFHYLQASGKSLTSIMARARSIVTVTDAMRLKSVEFNMEVRTTKAIMADIAGVITSKIATVLTPILRTVNNWVIKLRQGRTIFNDWIEAGKSTLYVLGYSVTTLGRFLKILYRITGYTTALKIAVKYIGGVFKFWAQTVKNVLDVFNKVLNVFDKFKMPKFSDAKTKQELFRLKTIFEQTIKPFTTPFLIFDDIVRYIKDGDKAYTRTRVMMLSLKKFFGMVTSIFKTAGQVIMDSFIKPIDEAIKKLQKFFKFSKDSGLQVPNINKNYDEYGNLIPLENSVSGGNTTTTIIIKNKSDNAEVVPESSTGSKGRTTKTGNTTTTTYSNIVN